MSQNAIVITQIALQLATQLQALIATQARARAEGRDVSDEELDTAAKGASDAIVALKTLR